MNIKTTGLNIQVTKLTKSLLKQMEYTWHDDNVFLKGNVLAFVRNVFKGENKTFIIEYNDKYYLCEGSFLECKLGKNNSKITDAIHVYI